MKRLPIDDDPTDDLATRDFDDPYALGDGAPEPVALHEIPADARLVPTPPPAADRNLTARPCERPPSCDEHYDAVFPEAMGTEWLARATGFSFADANDELEHTDYAFLSSDVSAPVVSAGWWATGDDDLAD